MPNITIDDKNYDLDSLSTEAKSQLQMIQICDQELGRIKAQLAIAQTARIAYSKALQEALSALPAGDTVKLN